MMAKYAKAYRKRNPEKVRVYKTERKLLTRKLALVPWADNTKIKKIYSDAARLTAETGIQYDVDHIVPLKHSLVCGLHWEGNLRVITRKENSLKSNKFYIE